MEISLLQTLPAKRGGASHHHPINAPSSAVLLQSTSPIPSLSSMTCMTVQLTLGLHPSFGTRSSVAGGSGYKRQTGRGAMCTACFNLRAAFARGFLERVPTFNINNRFHLGVPHSAERAEAFLCDCGEAAHRMYGDAAEAHRLTTTRTAGVGLVLRFRLHFPLPQCVGVCECVSVANATISDKRGGSIFMMYTLLRKAFVPFVA